MKRHHFSKCLHSEQTAPISIWKPNKDGGRFLNASTHKLPPEFLDYSRVTGINESMKTSQSTRLNISVSFNEHIRDVFYCKHFDGSSGNIESCCLLCPPNWKQTDSVSLGRNVSKQNVKKRFCIWSQRNSGMGLWSSRKGTFLDLMLDPQAPKATSMVAH